MDLFDSDDFSMPAPADAALGAALRKGEANLSQFFTPFWAADELVNLYLSHLTPADCVIEPSCGTGAFLDAIPREIAAVGVELDPTLAQMARDKTGRQVITGDFRVVDLSLRPTAVIGNPPFDLSVFDGMLERCHSLLPEGGTAGFILPAYALQTPSRILGYNEKWGMKADHLPRTLFPNLSKPLVFCTFTKDRRRALVGFALYRETSSVSEMKKRFQELLSTESGSVWRKAVLEALCDLQGEADLPSIYRVMEGRRPTGATYWKEKVRQTLQRDFRRVGEARWGLPLAA